MTLRVNGITKTYDPPPGWLRPFVRSAATSPVRALRDVSIDVRAGEVVGLLGPNGAGKTTLIKIICSLLEPTSGSVDVDEIDIATRSLDSRQRLGLVLTDDRGFYWRMDGRRNLEFFGVLSGLRPAVARKRAHEMLQRFDLPTDGRLVLGYSSGMRAKLNLARAQLAQPNLLVLDEPTRALDPGATAEVGRMLRSFAADGRAVFLATHRLDEATTVCDRVAVLIDGQVRHVGSATDLETRGHLATLLGVDGGTS